ncbi:oxidoreductase activity protein [[Candida] boidinii]|nr:oxidoreductase activity protein [[Candida] boidinii]OWB60505.1 oxidoreductase activity protein [[Candida] boidinii]OWB71094.1 oxidoreductase activity protein [[Candida] boidinii]
MTEYTKDSKIIIVGCGVFGLSNAYHLAKNGYKNITVFDRLDMDAINFTLLKGADTASGDINKIFRAHYAEKKHYQDLSLKCLKIWQEWDRDINLVPKTEAKKYTDLKILDLCSMITLDDQLGWEEKSTRENYAKDGLGPLRFDINDAKDVKRAEACGLGPKIKYALDAKSKIPNLEGSLDCSSGIIYASRSLQYLKYLCVNLGVKFILGDDKGTFEDYIYKDSNKRIIGGIKTQDGKSHKSDLVVVACGPWSTRMVPELDGFSTANSGNVVIFKIPDNRPDLKIKYSGKNFPVFGWKMGHSREKEHMAGIFMFPMVEPEGYMKIVVRQRKYVNNVTLNNGRVVSIPVTSRSNPPKNMLTKHIMTQIKEWMKLFFPDLVAANVKLQSKIVWYTDTIDNDYIYDFVPDKKGLFVSTGGSGHAFKMLPLLGSFLVNKLENQENFYTDLFKWRDPSLCENDSNGLREGINTDRDYRDQEISTKSDMNFGSSKF